MKQLERLQTVQESAAKLDAYLESEPWSDWTLTPIRGQARWERTRQIETLGPLIKTNVSLVVTSRAYMCEDTGPKYVLDESEGMIRRRLTISHEQRALAERRQRNSRSLGATVFQKHSFQLQTEFADVPDLIPRELTPKEQEAHTNYGGSRKPQVVASDSINFNFEVSHWPASDCEPEDVLILRNLQNGTVMKWSSEHLSDGDPQELTEIEREEREYPDQLAQAIALYLP